jgi:hypothetical protein
MSFGGAGGWCSDERRRRVLSKDLLGRMIAWRMQERAFGGLDRESLRFLDSLARHGG